MRDALLLLAAFVGSVVSMGWLALAFDVHWRQVHANAPRTSATATRLRWLGVMGLTTSLALCLSVDHGSMASLVFVMTLTAAALVIALTLAWRARWLRVLSPRMRTRRTS